MSLIDVAGMAKALGTAAASFAERNPVLLLSVDDAGNYAALAQIPKSVGAKLDAKAWLQVVCRLDFVFLL